MAAFGLPGFAIALVISRSFGLGFHLWLWQRRLGLVPKARDWWTLRGRRLAPMLHIGLPGAAENVAWRITFIVTVSFAAGFGEKALATHGYTIQVQNFILLFALATGFACEILVGPMIGAGDCTARTASWARACASASASRPASCSQRRWPAPG